MVWLWEYIGDPQHSVCTHLFTIHIQGTGIAAYATASADSADSAASVGIIGSIGTIGIIGTSSSSSSNTSSLDNTAYHCESDLQYNHIPENF